ncbi:MAG: hypothetical protein PHN75_02015 [Syntrophales bacterium]|nr:hypothetical protein [Syntrophales bacterium]
MKKNILAVSMVFFSLIFTTQASALELGARAYAWFPSMSADVRGSSNGSQGTTFNAPDILGLDNKPTYSVEAYGGLGKHHFSLMYTPFGYSGDKTLNQNIAFNGTTFNANSSVHTDLNFAMYDLKYQYDIVNLENILAGFSVGPILQVKYVSGEMKLTGAGSGNYQRQSFNVPIPMVGLGGHVGLIANRLEARAQVTGMGYSGNYVVEGLADISLAPIPFVSISAGYKIIKMKIDTNDFYMDSQFAGPYAALTVGF